MGQRFSWIDHEPESDSDRDALEKAYGRIGVPPGGDGLDHVLRIHGPMPATLEEHLAFYRGILRRKGPLSRAECEVIGVVVSGRNGCLY
ncbi:MAG: hypothetical protein AAGG01_21190 [Planctomycetota bacterium]